jgi:putative ABC transport system permease protein
MITLALRMLFNDKAKYLMLVSGVAFASLLMIQQSGVFCGLMSWTYSSLRNLRAPIWVMDPKVEQVNDPKPLRDTDVFRVRSIDGVAWAAPLYTGNVQGRLPNGNFKLVQLVGLDNNTFTGAPAPEKFLAGSLNDLRLPNTVIIDDFAVERLSDGLTHPDGTPRKIGVGDVFDINDHEARVVGIVKAFRSFTGGPYVFTTYDRALQYAPPTRRMLSFVLAAPAAGMDAAVVAERISRESGLQARTEEDFRSKTLFWFVKNTGIPISFGTTVLLGLIVGLVISGQTYYTFILENARSIAAFKAMGASMSLLVRMLITQSVVAGLIGFGIGVGLSAGFGFLTAPKGQPPFYLLPEILFAVGGFILLITISAALLGIIKVARMDPDTVFRG